MKRLWVWITFLAFLLNVGFLTACGEEKKKASNRSESDWSASGVAKDIEEMKKAGEKGKATDQPQPVPQPASQTPKK